MRAYRYNYFAACECYYPVPGPVEITVEDGRITSVAAVMTAEPVPEGHWGGYRTVEEVFAFIETALDRRAYRFEAAYHPKLGYPTKFNVDFTEQYPDDEEFVDLTDLTVIAREG